MLDVLSKVMVPLAASAALIGNVNSLTRIRWLSWCLVMVAVYLSVRVVLAVYFGIAVETYTVIEGDISSGSIPIHRGRALSFLADPNDLAQYLVACLPLAVLLWRRGRSAGNTLLVVIPICVLAVGIYLTRSRGGLLGLAFLVALAVSRVSRVGAPLAGVAFAVGMLAMGFSGGRETSVSGGTGGSRIELWADVFRVFLAHPIGGVGYGNIEEYLPATAHNTLLECLVEIGLPGLYFWLATFSVTFFQLGPLRVDSQVSEDARRFCRLALASLASAMVTSLFLSRTYALTLYVFLGVAFAAFLAVRREQAEPQPLFRFRWLVWNGVLVFLTLGAFFFTVRLKWLLLSLS